MKEKHQHNHDHHDHHMNHGTNQSQTQNHNQHKENHYDHSSHHKIMIIDFKKRLIVTSILTIPILLPFRETNSVLSCLIPLMPI